MVRLYEKIEATKPKRKQMTQNQKENK